MRTGRERSALRRVIGGVVVGGLLLLACDGSSDGTSGTESSITTAETPTVTGSSSSPSASSTVPVPGVPDVDARTAADTLDWLKGRGEAGLAMHHAAIALTGDAATTPTDRECETLIEELDRGPAPGQVLAMITNVPDPMLQELMMEERSLVRTVLQPCLAGHDAADGDDIDALAEVVGSIDARLSQLREAR